MFFDYYTVDWFDGHDESTNVTRIVFVALMRGLATKMWTNS